MNPERATILVYCRILGWMLAAAILVLSAAEIGKQVRLQHIRSEVSKRDFLAKVRVCVHQGPGPAPSWEACEQMVRAAQ